MIQIIRKFRQLLDRRERRNAVLLFAMILCTGVLEAVGVASIMPFLSVEEQYLQMMTLWQKNSVPYECTARALTSTTMPA